ncbi:LysR family transcriptional regulator [Paremcibacter congregatus]|uniref:LysR family transcriptional regulator n=1 Tax=Paremcibacter congregatus TaxID=2043170 RepID=UPI0030ED7CF6|tara:strand:+ start:1352 stop:2212 length:861 start_codon:yes stop_codon:yes gene_type:complete
MDITQVRTFIAVADTGSFIAAADRVHVTQSTVSIRIRNLEDQLGTYLFERSKQGASLTIAGKQFLKHAIALTKIWDQARLDVGIGEEHETILRIGGQVSLWDGFLMKLLPWMRVHAPEIAIRTEMGYSPDLTQKLSEGSIDIGIMYRPEHRPGFKIKQIFEDEMILVSSQAEDKDIFENDYIFVNWGPEFLSDHALNFPDMKTPRVSLDLGTLGIEYLLLSPASGYFPRRIAEPLIREERVRLVDWAPKFNYPAYISYADDIDSDLMNIILKGIKVISRDVGQNPL